MTTPLTTTPSSPSVAPAASGPGAGGGIAGALPGAVELRGLHKRYAAGSVAVHALRGLDLTVAHGEFLAITGPSGCGKSTLLNVIGLLDVADAGDYSLFGEPVTALRETEQAARRSRDIGFVFQQFHLLRRTSALDNVALPQIYADRRDPLAPLRLLERVGLGDRTGHRPTQLSGGQQQRVAIARALVNGPRLLLADEPTGNLDSASSHDVMGLLKELNDAGLTIVMVTHEADVAAYAARVITMRDGRIERDERRRPAAPPVARGVPLPHRRAGWLRRWMTYAGRTLAVLANNKVRTGLSVLGILIGVAAVIGVVALGSGAKRSIEENLKSMGTNLLIVRPGARRSGAVMLQTGAVSRLTLADAAALGESLATARRVAPVVSGRAQVEFGNRNWSTSVRGVTPTYPPMRNAEPDVGRMFDEAEMRGRNRVALLGRTVARELFGTDDPIGAHIKINRMTFQVIGLLPKRGADSWRDRDDEVYVPLDTAMKRLFGSQYLDEIDIEIDDAAHMPAAEADIQALMRQRARVPASEQEPVSIHNLEEVQSALSETSRTLSWLLMAVAGVSLIVGGIGIMNIMLVSVVERTREIGLHKAVGARQRDILAQFLIESVLVSCLGGALGIAAGVGVATGFSRMAGWPTLISPAAVAVAFAFAALTGIVFGLWPAVVAARLTPMTALRHE